MFVEKDTSQFLFVFYQKTTFCSVLLESRVKHTVYSLGTSIGRQDSHSRNKCIVMAVPSYLFLICF